MSKIVLFLLLFPISPWAQDPHFSQFHLATLDVNAANTGRVDSRSRLTAIYRTQWNTVLGAQAYQSAYAAFESQISCLDKHFFAIGITGKLDWVGDIKLTRSYGYGSLAYHHSLSKNQFLSAGFQLGLIDFSLQPERLQFDEQFDGIGFNGNLPSFEDGNAFRKTVMDFNIGLTYYDTERKFTLGMALYHVLQPNYSFFDNEDYRLGMGLGLHGDIFNKSGTLGFRFLFRKQSLIKNKQWYSVPMFAFGPEHRKKDSPPPLQIGLGARLSGHENNALPGIDAVLVNLLIRMERSSLSLNYDMNISPLRAASRTVGGLELALVLPIGGEESACVICPTF